MTTQLSTRSTRKNFSPSGSTSPHTLTSIPNALPRNWLTASATTSIVMTRCHQIRKCSLCKTTSCSSTNPTKLCPRRSSLELQMAKRLRSDLFSQRSTVDALKLGRLIGRKHVTRLAARKKSSQRISMILLSPSLLLAILLQNVVSSCTRRCVPQLRTRSDFANTRWCRPQMTDSRPPRPFTRAKLTISFKFMIETFSKNKRPIYWLRN